LKTLSFVCAAAFALALAACSGGTVPSSGSGLPASGAKHRAGVKVRFTIHIPKKKHHTRTKRGGKYISSATQSMSIALTSSDGGGGTGNQQVGLTPTSTGCSSTLASTQCILTLTLTPSKTYNIVVETYDGPISGGNVSGNLLSGGQNIGYVVQPGVNNQVNLVLGGVAASLAVTSLSTNTMTGSNAGFNVYGHTPVKFSVVPLDADSNFIVGAGAPQASVTLTGGPAVLATAGPASPNNYTLTSSFVATNPTVPSNTSLSISATPVPNSGGATMTANVPLALYQPWLYVTNQAGTPPIQAFDEDGNPEPALTGNFANMNSPSDIAYDARNNRLYVVNNNNQVNAYDLQGNQIALSGNSNNPFPGVIGGTGLAFNANNDWFYVAQCGGNAIDAYDEEGNPEATPGGFPGLVNPYKIAFDTQNNVLYAAFAGGAGSVQSYDEQGNAGTTSVPVDNARGVAYDRLNDTIYAPYTFNGGAGGPPWMAAFDGNGNARTLTGSAGSGPFSDFNQPYGILADPYNGHIYLANDGGTTVEAYDGQGTPTGVVMSGLNQPNGITIVP
jgi:hypothetical protein